jgi:hypothetical protein
LHIQNGGSKRIWILTYSGTGNFLLAWAGQFSGIVRKVLLGLKIRAGCIFSLLLNVFEWRLRFKI